LITASFGEDWIFITVQIDELFGEFVSVEVATIGYVAAILLVQIEEEVDSVKFKFPGG
jgi:hypothetical protein